MPCEDRKAFAIARPGSFGVKVGGMGPVNAGPVTWARGDIHGFSSASRRRMLVKLSALDWSAQPCYFVTLTWHNEWGDWQDWKAKLRAFRARLQRACPWFAAAVWKQEFQTRGAPHYHLAVFAKHDINLPLFRRWVAIAWNAICAPGDMAHLQAATNVKRATNTQGQPIARLMQYLGKYMAKAQTPVDAESGEIIATGRCWGVWNEAGLPWGAWEAYEMSLADYATLTRRIRRWGQASRYLGRITAQWSGFLVLGDGPNLVAQLFRGLDIRKVDHDASEGSAATESDGGVRPSDERLADGLRANGGSERIAGLRPEPERPASATAVSVGGGQRSERQPDSDRVGGVDVHCAVETRG